MRERVREMIEREIEREIEKRAKGKFLRIFSKRDIVINKKGNDPKFERIRVGPDKFIFLQFALSPISSTFSA